MTAAPALGSPDRQPGGDITVGASVTLVRFLIAEGLLDELSLLVHPIVADAGGYLFAATRSSRSVTRLLVAHLALEPGQFVVDVLGAGAGRRRLVGGGLHVGARQRPVVVTLRLADLALGTLA